MSAVTLMRSAVSQTSEGRSQRQIGERWVRALSLVAVTVATWMLCTLMGGTWMFVARNMHPHEALVAMEQNLGQPISLPYVFPRCLPVCCSCRACWVCSPRPPE